MLWRHDARPVVGPASEMSVDIEVSFERKYVLRVFVCACVRVCERQCVTSVPPFIRHVQTSAFSASVACILFLPLSGHGVALL